MSVVEEEVLKVDSKTNETVIVEDSLQKHLRMNIYIIFFHLILCI